MLDLGVVYLPKLVEVMLHIFNGGINWQSSNKDLLCPRHHLATQKKCLSNLICFWKISEHSAYFPSVEGLLHFTLTAVCICTGSLMCVSEQNWMGVHVCVRVSADGWGLGGVRPQGLSVKMDKWIGAALRSLPDSHSSQPGLSDEGWQMTSSPRLLAINPFWLHSP